MVTDALDRYHQKRTMPNRSGIWKYILITNDSIDRMMLRVGGEGQCTCGKLNKDHPFSERVLELTGCYLYELCTGKLGKF